MFLIHGGAFEFGSGLVPLFDGTNLALEGDVMVVNIQYRLGVFGFLSTQSSDDDLTGNYGIKDQRMALKWVHNNIEAFGGDPNKLIEANRSHDDFKISLTRNVTIFGESVGAQSVAIHLINRKSDNYFRSAIMQSNPFSIQFETKDDAHFQTEEIALILECTIASTSAMISCLKTKSEQNVLAAMEKFDNEKIETGQGSLKNQYQRWGPVIDGEEIPMNQLNAFAQNLPSSRKRVLLGSNSDEGFSFVSNTDSDAPYFKALDIIRKQARNSKKAPAAAKLQELYPERGSSREVQSKAATDYIFMCATRKVASELTRAGNRVWVYLLAQPLSMLKGFVIPEKAILCADLVFLFNNIENFGWFSMTSEEKKISAQMISYWSNFARSGKQIRPVKPDEKWSMVSKNSTKHLVFKAPANVMSDWWTEQGAQCDFWNTYF